MTILLNRNMSDSDDQVTKKKQIINDDQSAGCSKMSNTCAQRLLYETQSTDSNQRLVNHLLIYYFITILFYLFI